MWVIDPTIRARPLRTFTDMQSRGIDGVIVDWYGKGQFCGHGVESFHARAGEIPQDDLFA